MFQREYLLFLINGVYFVNEYEVKYDFGLDLTSNNSLKLINDRIAADSVILEFGPANGRLTKYLKNNKNCEIDIVEINPISGKIAAKYSRRALIGNEDGNIENYEWLEVFKDEKYDYILFADVLEHLKNPEEVLDKCRKLLKKTGAILFSVPNVANNNIILSLLKDEFQYTSTGLLDDTHIHFFAYNSINKLIKKLGFFISYIDGTRGNVGETEINVNYDEFYEYNTDIIKNHKLGEIYQYVYELRLNDACKKINNVDIEYLQNSLIKYDSHCFLYVNGNYTEENKICALDTRYVEDEIITKFDLKNKVTEGKIRFDPLERQFCTCEIISIETDAKDFYVKAFNAYSYDNNKYTFFNMDPIIEIIGDFSSATYIVIKYKINILGMSELVNIADNLNNQMFVITQKLNSTLRDRENLINEINAIKSTRGYRLLEFIRKFIRKFI